MSKVGSVVVRASHGSLDIGYVISEEFRNEWLHLRVNWVRNKRIRAAASWGEPNEGRSSRTELCRVDQLIIVSPGKVAASLAEASRHGTALNLKNK